MQRRFVVSRFKVFLQLRRPEQFSNVPNDQGEGNAEDLARRHDPTRRNSIRIADM